MYCKHDSSFAKLVFKVGANLTNDIAYKCRNFECGEMNSQLKYGSNHGRDWDKMSKKCIDRWPNK